MSNDELIRVAASAMGRKGGPLGGKARFAKMNAKERLEFARAGGRAALAKLTPEQRRARVLKGVETRRRRADARRAEGEEDAQAAGQDND